MDRNEGEHQGNVRELERMLRVVGLDPVSIWLSGRPYAGLREVRRAGTIVSLPHGRAAAKILARRLGARLIEAELPFGLEASRRFMERLGRECGREAEAARFIARELDAVTPKLEWVVPHSFLDRRFVYAGDPHYAPGFVEQLEGLGAEVAGLVLMGGAHHLAEAPRAALQKRPGTVFEPIQREFMDLWRERFRAVDLVVGNGFVFREANLGYKRMEFGFPSEFTHFLREEPFLGFQGALAFLGRLSNDLVKGLSLDVDSE
jgi:nitrogenase molybdenum-iron protein alpha/beta subunit